jgi:Rha family phage regulatory protein
MNQPIIKIEHGKPMTSSVNIAEVFEKSHKNVLQSIEGVRSVVPEEWDRLNFQPISYRDSSNREQPAYLLTRAGFAMTALGFTGKKALEFRRAYVDKFEEMSAKLHEKEMLKVERAYVEQKYLPFDQEVVRASVGLSDACKHLRILGVDLTLTPGQLKGRIKRGELEGHQNERGHWRIYVDQVTKLATGH